LNVKEYAAEFFGTYALVFAGTGAIVINDVTGGAVSHLGIALTFGLIVTVMIYAVGDISGAHINPAVTVGFWVAHRLPGRQVLPYVLSQCLGALAGSLTIRVLFVGHPTLGATLPSGSFLQSLVLEVVLTFLLMFVILCVSSGAREKGLMTGAAVGGVVALEALFAGPISGASMNPARSLGPALVAGYLNSLWIYFLAPVIGAWLAVLACRCVHESGCCGAARPSQEELD
jgi:aquaporin NIP